MSDARHETPGGDAPVVVRHRRTAHTPGDHSDHDHPDALHEDAAAVKKDSVSLAIATGVYGVSFGALAIAAGLTTWQTMALSLLLFSGGSQFAVVGVLGGGGSGASAVATSSLLGVRNGIYGLQINQFLRPRGLRRLLAAQVTIDESAAMSVGRPTEQLSRTGFWWTGLGVYVMWNTMTFVGTVAGNAMGDPKKYGLDAAAVGAFMALLWPRLGTLQGKVTAALAACIALGLSPLTQAGVPVLATVVAAVVVGWWYSTRHDSPSADGEPSADIPGVETSRADAPDDGTTPGGPSDAGRIGSTT